MDVEKLANDNTWRTELDDLVEVVALASPGCSVYLTGSRAIGTSRFDSDIDVIVVLPDSARESNIMDVCLKLVDHFGKDDPKNRQRRMAVPKVTWWHDLHSVYQREAATFGLLFWHNAQLLAGPERRFHTLAESKTIRDSACHAIVRWLALTLFRLWRHCGNSKITIPINSIGRACRALLLLKENVWIPNYTLAISRLIDNGNTILTGLRKSLIDKDTAPGFVTAHVHTWVNISDNLVIQVNEHMPSLSESKLNLSTRMWLRLDRPLPFHIAWYVVPSVEEIAHNIPMKCKQTEGPWIAENLVTLALSPQLIRMRDLALITYLKFNRYNKWIEGYLSTEQNSWQSHSFRCLEYLERLQLVRSFQPIDVTLLDNLHEQIRKNAYQASVQARQDILSEWLTVCRELRNYP